MEIQRHSNIVPMGVQHMTASDLVINGHLIPANTRVLAVFAEVMKGDYWSEGEVFRPDRFLDDAGQVKKDTRLIPFSVGKRQCLGETLAKNELFLFFTAMLQHYNFSPESSENLPVEEAMFGITCLPKPYKAVLTKRI